jgi:hypothetical protein
VEMPVSGIPGTLGNDDDSGDGLLAVTGYVAPGRYAIILGARKMAACIVWPRGCMANVAEVRAAGEDDNCCVDTQSVSWTCAVSWQG